MKLVSSGFGGLALIRKDYFLTSFFNLERFKKNFTNKFLKPDMICEHWGYSNRLNFFGKIYINKNSTALWYQEKDHSEDEFFNYVKFFINNKNLNNIL